MTIGNRITKLRLKEPKYKKQLRDFFGVATVVKGDCPCCGKAEIYSNANYCPDCGQKLNW